jgi:hypothetical protein
MEKEITDSVPKTHSGGSRREPQLRFKQSSINSPQRIDYSSSAAFSKMIMTKQKTVLNFSFRQPLSW